MEQSTMQQGLSLLELMVTLAVAALILTLGVPSFQGVVRNNRIVGATNDLIATLHLARSEAVKLRATTVICASDDPDAAAPACGNDFTSGWVAFVDRNGNGVVNADADPDLDDTILRVQTRVHNSLAASVDGNAYMAFAASGYGRTIAALGARAEAIVLCDSRGNKDVADGISAARVVVLTETGRPDTLRHVDDVADYGGCP